MKTNRQIKNRITRKNRRGGGLFDYIFPKTSIIQGNVTDDYNIEYNGILLKCDVCSNDRFSHVDVTVNSSKTGDIIFGDTSIFDHPLTIYRCKTCSYCKVIYRMFGIKNEDRLIKEIQVTGAPPLPQQQPLQAVQQLPPAQPPIQPPIQAQPQQPPAQNQYGPEILYR